MIVFFRARTLRAKVINLNKLITRRSFESKRNVQIVSSDVFNIKNNRLFEWKMIRKKKSVLFLKIRKIIFSSTSSSFSFIRVLIMINSFLVVSFLIICYLIFICFLLIRFHVILKKFSIFIIWNRVFCRDIRNVHSRKLISSSIRNRDLAINCDDFILTLLFIITSCKNLHCYFLK